VNLPVAGSYSRHPDAARRESHSRVTLGDIHLRRQFLRVIGPCSLTPSTGRACGPSQQRHAACPTEIAQNFADELVKIGLATIVVSSVSCPNPASNKRACEVLYPASNGKTPKRVVNSFDALRG
jgi:hypothetical protein